MLIGTETHVEDAIEFCRAQVGSQVHRVSRRHILQDLSALALTTSDALTPVQQQRYGDARDEVATYGSKRFTDKLK